MEKDMDINKQKLANVVGEEAATRIDQRFDSYEELAAASKTQLATAAGITEDVADSVISIAQIKVASQQSQPSQQVPQQTLPQQPLVLKLDKTKDIEDMNLSEQLAEAAKGDPSEDLLQLIETNSKSIAMFPMLPQGGVNWTLAHQLYKEVKRRHGAKFPDVYHNHPVKTYTEAVAEKVAVHPRTQEVLLSDSIWLKVHYSLREFYRYMTVYKNRQIDELFFLQLVALIPTNIENPSNILVGPLQAEFNAFITLRENSDKEVIQCGREIFELPKQKANQSRGIVIVTETEIQTRSLPATRSSVPRRLRLTIPGHADDCIVELSQQTQRYHSTEDRYDAVIGFVSQHYYDFDEETMLSPYNATFWHDMKPADVFLLFRMLPSSFRTRKILANVGQNLTYYQQKFEMLTGLTNQELDEIAQTYQDRFSLMYAYYYARIGALNEVYKKGGEED
jgi:hypothetical protein